MAPIRSRATKTTDFLWLYEGACVRMNKGIHTNEGICHPVAEGTSTASKGCRVSAARTPQTDEGVVHHAFISAATKHSRGKKQRRRYPQVNCFLTERARSDVHRLSFPEGTFHRRPIWCARANMVGCMCKRCVAVYIWFVATI